MHQASTEAEPPVLPALVLQVAQLEALAPTQPSELEGRWELLYSDVAPFRASPFFLTVRGTSTRVEGENLISCLLGSVVVDVQ